MGTQVGAAQVLAPDMVPGAEPQGTGERRASLGCCGLRKRRPRKPDGMFNLYDYDAECDAMIAAMAALDVAKNDSDSSAGGSNSKRQKCIGA